MPTTGNSMTSFHSGFSVLEMETVESLDSPSVRTRYGSLLPPRSLAAKFLAYKQVVSVVLPDEEGRHLALPTYLDNVCFEDKIAIGVRALATWTGGAS